MYTILTGLFMLSVPTVATVQTIEVLSPEPPAPIIFDFSSTTTIKSYVLEQAKLKGVDTKLVEKIVSCESGYWPQQSQIIRADGTRERSFGIWQFHLPSWPDLTEAQAMDIEYSTEKALVLLGEGKQDLWTCGR